MIMYVIQSLYVILLCQLVHNWYFFPSFFIERKNNRNSYCNGNCSFFASSNIVKLEKVNVVNAFKIENRTDTSWKIHNWVLSQSGWLPILNSFLEHRQDPLRHYAVT